MDGLKKEPLGKYEILVSADHTFGTDAVLLANFAGMFAWEIFQLFCACKRPHFLPFLF